MNLSLFTKSIVTCCAFLTLLNINVEAQCVYAEEITAEELKIGNMINWTTTVEIDNNHFTVQKSDDGISFVTIGEVKGAGNSEKLNNYRFLDVSTGNKRNFYRLIQVDVDGTERYTPTLVVNRNSTNAVLITSMSTTVTDKLFSVTMRSIVEEKLSFIIVDSNNHIVKNGEMEIVEGANIISYDLGEIPNGWYTIEMQIDDEQETVVIQKVNLDQVPKQEFVVKE